MKKKIISVLAAGLLSLGFAGAASAISVTAHITADNHYGLYVGNAAGSNLQYVGRNETGELGLGGYNWSLAETFTFNVSAGDYIYVAAWDDGGPQMWTADFNWDADAAPELVTDALNWKFIQGGTPIPGVSSPPVAISDMQAKITGAASWLSIGQALAYNSAPWGNISNVSDSAKFIWGDNTDYGSAYQIFRTAVPLEPAPVPEPSTMLLLGGGLAGLIFWRRKKS